MQISTLTAYQVAAVRGMARATTQYNRGVLCMLGLESLASEHEMASAYVELVNAKCESIEAAEGVGMFDEPTPAVIAARAKLNDAAQREKAAWAKIEAIISSVMP